MMNDSLTIAYFCAASLRQACAARFDIAEQFLELLALGLALLAKLGRLAKSFRDQAALRKAAPAGFDSGAFLFGFVHVALDPSQPVIRQWRQCAAQRVVRRQCLQDG